MTRTLERGIDAVVLGADLPFGAQIRGVRKLMMSLLTPNDPWPPMALKATDSRLQGFTKAIHGKRHAVSPPGCAEASTTPRPSAPSLASRPQIHSGFPQGIRPQV